MSRNKIKKVRGFPTFCHECRCDITGVEDQPNGRPRPHRVNGEYYWRCGQCKPIREMTYDWQTKYGKTNRDGWPCDEDGRPTTIDKVVQFRVGYKMVEDEDGEETKQPIFVKAPKSARKFKPDEKLMIKVEASEEKFKFEDKQATQASTSAILDLFN